MRNLIDKLNQNTKKLLEVKNIFGLVGYMIF